MAYEIYKKELTQKEYFSNWDSDNYKQLTESLRNQIYQKYLVKTKVFQRDKFRCQNADCKTPESELTMHHIKWQKNGGENKERNCVTLCKVCHKGFHRGKKDITFLADTNLPEHIKGHTFKLNKLDEIDWKKLKKEMRQFRKNIKREYNLSINMSELYFLIKWLEDIVDYDDD